MPKDVEIEFDDGSKIVVPYPTDEELEQEKRDFLALMKNLKDAGLDFEAP